MTTHVPTAAYLGRANCRWAEVDIAVLRNNAREICAFVGPDVAVIAMVKANAYGHGMELAAQAFLDGGAAWLGVCCASEAIRLRSAGFTCPILITGWVEPENLENVIRAGVEMAVYDCDQVEAIAKIASFGINPKLHIKIDTGMHRLGAAPGDASALVSVLQKYRRKLDVGGIFTHFADADGRDPEFTKEQYKRLMRLVPAIKVEFPEAIVHCCNSAATLRFPEMHQQLVRPGIALYGYPPLDTSLRLQPAMTLVGRVTQTKTIPPGETVGYGRTWAASRSTPIAVVSLGYADGISRLLSNCGEALIQGQRCSIVGRISMDQLTVDISELDGVSTGEEVVIFGRQNGARLGADEVAAKYGTISYEVLCAVGERVPRIPVGLL